MLAVHLPGPVRVQGDRIDGLQLIDRMFRVDQAPIGRSGRSTPATYTGIMDRIRKLFGQTDEARRRGYKPGRFSFNSPGGRCEACAGDGTLRVEIYFLPDVFLTCRPPVCTPATSNG
ncbi:MAG: hypothetical protein ACRDTD_03860 [Pseudonocardiaceae bacterium]